MKHELELIEMISSLGLQMLLRSVTYVYYVSFHIVFSAILKS